jgi:glucokinase
MKKVAIGVDIGGTNTAFGLVDSEGKVVLQHNISTRTHSKVEDYVLELSTEIKNLISRLGTGYEVIGLGIGAPNGNYYTGTIEEAPNLPWRGKIHFTKLFQQHFDLPVVLTNDANAAAIGERVYGGAKGMNNFIVITLGTGLGSGIVVNGKLVYGHDGFAGELGHTTVVPNGRDCNCGRKGCLETYASATGVVRTVFSLLSQRTAPSDLRNVPYSQVTSKMVYEAALKGDPIALETFDETAHLLGRALADAMAFSSPEAIFLFGGLAKSGNLLLDRTKMFMEEYNLSIFKNKVKLLPSQITENAAVLGAAALVVDEVSAK